MKAFKVVKIVVGDLLKVCGWTLFLAMIVNGLIRLGHFMAEGTVILDPSYGLEEYAILCFVGIFYIPLALGVAAIVILMCITLLTWVNSIENRANN